ncbi:lamin-like protein [Tripterygium wilfordii]|uniref:lamin-like protein n=1 Tax=Tripterygium wilfordii TaxID=458696 RepID=UPI0018F83132|nr:lamin-like protein [Tripterygium wilfordii]
MEGVSRGILSPIMVVVVALIFSMAVMVPEVSGTRWIVGANMGWSANVNYTIWAQDKKFYYDDWLFFVYDRNQMDVLEVNKTDYDACNADHPLHNYTTGAGRDVVHLNVTRHYYFISGKGFCFSGMKLAIRVQNLPPPPTAAPSKSDAPGGFTYRGHYVLPVVFAIGALWDAFIHFL